MKQKLFIFSILGLIFCSCSNNQVQDQYKVMPNKQWHKDSIVSFKINEVDSISKYNLFLNIRNTTDYEFSNIYLISSINFPNGKVVTDTLEYEMANSDGSFIGKEFGGVIENKLWYKENVQFTEEGDYVLELKQAVRENGAIDGLNTLNGIQEIGFRIEKVNP
ncbi:gliding motility lipoprotein GldH [Mesonia sp. K7]|uniref:gliding motility lipoprotein GldH n=1 Tax=Mesonia sp. K7 TaxID=2218606 RepID=UPI000DA74AE4|nr:gliding motility lipoprotein GldH [Mesonia sp. K7]PZD77424.1 gliding motility lipoprotein GldH [Mesonia sp. K7]